MQTKVISGSPRSTPNLLEQSFAVLALLIYSGTLMAQFFAPLHQSGAIPASSTPLRLFLFLLVYGITAILLLPDFDATLKLLGRHKFLALLLLLCATSALWSVEPGETLEKSAGIAGCSMFAFYLVLRFPFATLLRILAIVMSVIVILSYLTALFLPDIGVMEGMHNGLWSGVFQHKNGLGFYSTLAGVIFLALYLCSPTNRHWPLLGHITSCLLLLFSCSKASMLVWIILFGAIGFYLHSINLRRPAIITLLSIILCAASLGLQTRYNLFPPILLNQAMQLDHADPHSTLDAHTAAMKAPDSITLRTGMGRVRLWGELWGSVEERLWLGHGIGGFWLGNQGPSAHVRENELWKPPHAHNGFVDLALHLGIAGVTLFLLFIFGAARYTLRAAAQGKLDPQALTYSAILASVLLANVGESFLLAANSLPWILVILTTIKLSDLAQENGPVAAIQHA